MKTRTHEEDIGGRKVMFKFLTRRIRADVEELARRWFKSRTAHTLELAGYPPDEIASQLSKLDSAPVDINQETIPFLMTTDGADIALESHLVNPDESPQIDEIDDPRGLVMKLWDGLLVPRVSTDPAANGEEPADADPTVGKVWGPTNPPSSGGADSADTSTPGA